MDEQIVDRQGVDEQGDGAQVTGAQRASEQPAREQPVSERSVSEQPMSDRSASEQPTPSRPLRESTPDKKPLRDRVVLVLGAGDLATRTLALHASARGASLVCAGAVLGPVLETAGFAAATGGTARVIESPAPPLLGSALLRAAEAVLARATDAFVAEAGFPSATEARAAANELATDLDSDATIVLVPARPEGGSKAYALRKIDEWLATRLPRAEPRSSERPR